MPYSHPLNIYLKKFKRAFFLKKLRLGSSVKTKNFFEKTGGIKNLHKKFT
nr:MAG TPA: hypothetical protein [Caudoviricetes sp.]